MIGEANDGQRQLSTCEPSVMKDLDVRVVLSQRGMQLTRKERIRFLRKETQLKDGFHQGGILVINSLCLASVAQGL
jgi:hypothetical protein